MNTIKSKAIEELKEKANKLLEMAQKIETMIPDNLPDSAYVWATEYDLRIELPYNLNLLKQIRKLLGKGWRLDGEFTDDKTGNKFFIYLHTDGTDLTITLKPEARGATCQRKQVGVKEVPIFEVVCN